jgi:hypothetical protein
MPGNTQILHTCVHIYKFLIQQSYPQPGDSWDFPIQFAQCYLVLAPRGSTSPNTTLVRYVSDPVQAIRNSERHDGITINLLECDSVYLVHIKSTWRHTTKNNYIQNISISYSLSFEVSTRVNQCNLHNYFYLVHSVPHSTACHMTDATGSHHFCTQFVLRNAGSVMQTCQLENTPLHGRYAAFMKVCCLENLRTTFQLHVWKVYGYMSQNKNSLSDRKKKWL